MEVVYINTIEDIKSYGPVSIAHGFFDGVHRAHKALIDEAKKYALLNDCLTGVVTFNKRIDCTSCDKKAFLDSLKISTIERKIELFESYGVDIVFIINFDNFKDLSAKEYISSMIPMFGTLHFVMGKDNSFGAMAQGNYENIFDFAQNKFEITIVELIKDVNQKISSSEIKQHIMYDDIKVSNDLLGYYYQIHGTVVKGKQLGREIGFPTANLKISDMVIIPHINVYATMIKIDGKLYKSMTNIGYNPTVDFRDELSVETYIFDFDENIYGKEVYLYFVAKVRNERKFEKLDDLLQQLHADKTHVEELLRNVDLNKII